MDADITKKGLMIMIDEMIEKLLSEPVANENEIKFTDRAIELIHKIAETCNDMQIVQETQKQAEEYAEGLTAEQVYYDMLHKIVNAPTMLHMRFSVRLLIPIIDRKLKERGM